MKGLNPGEPMLWFWVIVRVCSVVLRRTDAGVDWRFDNLSGSHHQSDDFRSGCRNISQHQQQSFSGLHYKPGRSLKPQQNPVYNIGVNTNGMCTLYQKVLVAERNLLQRIYASVPIHVSVSVFDFWNFSYVSNVKTGFLFQIIQLPARNLVALMYT